MSEHHVGINFTVLHFIKKIFFYFDKSKILVQLIWYNSLLKMNCFYFQ